MSEPVDYTKIGIGEKEKEAGALPSLDGQGTESVLGAPESKAKSKSNVNRLALLGMVLAAFLFIIAGLLIFQKTHKKSAAANQEAPQLVKPKFATKNAAVESDSIEKTKAAIKKQEAENKAKLQAIADAQAAAQKASEAEAANKAAMFMPRPGAGPAPASASTFAFQPHQAPPTGQAVPLPPTPEERRLAGGVLLDNSGSKPAKGGSNPAPDLTSKEGQQAEAARRMAALGFTPDGKPLNAPGTGGSLIPSTSSLASQSGPGGGDSLAGRLQPTVLQARSAGRLPNLTYLLKKGTTIPCALKTGIDTTLPGFVICMVLNDVYSANGKTVLIERGATVFGEQQSSLKQGQERTFVIWQRIDNPSGIYANIDSPAVDSMGYSGISGYVDTHFWTRFGGAIMLSLIKDFSAAYAQRLANSNSSNGSTGTVPYQNTQQATQDMAADALRNSINIPPTLVVNPATVVNVMVARDVSFENVFSLVE